MSIAENLKKIKESLPKGVTLVAVSKTKKNSDILEAYNAGQRIFGENKVQELSNKYAELPKDIQWHMIGHLQSNKVKYIAPFVSLIHAVDSLKLMKEINKRAEQNNRVIDCLLQVHIASESTKFGFGINEINNTLFESEKFSNINIVGLMGMATFTDDQKKVNNEFKLLNNLFNEIKNNSIKTLSIGMSGDYKLAISNSSTMIRVGSAIFGNRK
ncbi:MAG: YggS family pyridoxal phosphate-dependent enzyme [Flavobacteriales bacterium]|nr:YggS family pyridoxal phosphate-dependent enzyme [Flavobacteriales bacterium]|tara:strand:- start:6725 stop:7366 length:642 start_codon:yes stop_codon:yes gene_type:complete